MKNKILPLLFVLFTFYLSGVVASASFNVSHWSEMIRILISFFGAFALLISMFAFKYED